jgi:general secretion pathway protein D
VRNLEILKMRTSPPFLGALTAASLAVAGCTTNSDSPASAPTGGETKDGAAVPAAAPSTQTGEQSLRAQKTAALVESYLADAQAKRSRGDVEGAHQALLDAYEMDPGNEAVRTLLSASSVELGKRPATVGDVARGAADRDRVRRVAARLEVEDKVTTSSRHEATGDFDGAIRALQDAELVLRWNPYLAGTTDTGVTEAQLKSRIAELMAKKAAQERDIAAERDQRAMAEKSEREREERERAQNLVNRFLRQANDAFYAERYKEAADFCNQVLDLQSGHVEAAELKITAQKAWHSAQQAQFQTSYKDHWREVFDQIDLMNAPVTEEISFPGKQEWEAIALRGPMHFRLQGEHISPEDQRILDILNNTRVELNFDDTKLPAAVEWLSLSTGINFIIDQPVLDAGTDTGALLKVASVTAKGALELVSTVYGVQYVVRNGVITIISKDTAKGGEYIEIYDVRDLINKVASFPSSDFNLSPSGAVEEEPPEPPEPTPFVIEGDALKDLITNNIDPTTWEGNSNVTINLQPSGALVVRQTGDVHQKIDKLLSDLRANARTMVNIQTRFLSLEDRFLEDIGVDFRGLNGQNGSSDAASVPNIVLDDFGTPGSGGVGSPGAPVGTGTGNDAGLFFTEGGDFDARGRLENLYDLSLGDEDFSASGGASVEFTFFDDTVAEAILRAVTKTSQSEVIHAPALTVFNGQRAHINVLNHISYVKDFEAEIAQGAVIADPIVAVLRDGPTLDVRPVVSSDKRFVTVEVRPTLLDLVEPIATFRTSLAVGNEVELQLPVLKIQRLRTTVTIPDGATLMLGGMKSLVDTRLDSGIPFLKDIPLVSFFASRTGTEKSRTKVMILLRAKIIIPEEFEPAVARK